MGRLTCPACAAKVEVDPIAEAVTICPVCLSSLALKGKSARRATAEDTTVLSDSQLAQLRKARKQYREAAQ